MDQWELPQLLFSAFDSHTPVVSQFDSDRFRSPVPVMSSPDSDERKQEVDQAETKPGLEKSTSEDPNIDDRKRRRMISNRESARRSRMRKQNHIENLRNQLNRLRIENRKLFNHLRVALHGCHRLRKENDRLQLEQSVLRQKLSEINQIMIFRQLQQFSTPSAYFNSMQSEQIPTSNYIINNMINT